MAALQTDLVAWDLPDDLKRLRIAIEAAVPVGREQHRREVWGALTPELRARASALLDRFGDLDPSVNGHQHRTAQQLGKATDRRSLQRARVGLEAPDTAVLMVGHQPARGGRPPTFMRRCTDR